MITVTVNTEHPEGLALAATEIGAARLSSARAMIHRIGKAGEGRADNARRKLSAKALREAAASLEAAAGLLEAGL